MSLLNTDTPISDHITGIDAHLNDMIQYLIENKDTFFKSQQRNEKDLTDEQKRNIAREIFDQSKSLFLSRFGKQLREDHLKYFEKYTDDPTDGYDLNFYIQTLRRYFRKRKTDVKNRRYGALNKMISDNTYFSETEMMRRNPLLYEQLVGRYMTEDEKKKRDNIDLVNITLVNVLLEGIDRDETRQKRIDQEKWENGGIEEEEDSDEDDNGSRRERMRKENRWREEVEEKLRRSKIRDDDRLKEKPRADSLSEEDSQECEDQDRNRLKDENKLEDKTRLDENKSKIESRLRSEDDLRDENSFKKENSIRDEDSLRDNKLKEESLRGDHLKMDIPKDFSKDATELAKINVLKEDISKVNISKEDNSKENTSRMVSSEDGDSKMDILKEGSSRMEISREGSSKMDFSKAGTSRMDTSEDETSKINISPSGASKTNNPKINISLGNISKDFISQISSPPKNSHENPTIEPQARKNPKDYQKNSRNNSRKNSFEDLSSQQALVKWGEFDKGKEEPKPIRNWIRPRSTSPKEDIFITATERKLLKEEFVSIMYQSFIDGNDTEFDYNSVDNNEDYDNIEIRNYDAEEEYFDAESPEEIRMGEDNEMNGDEMNIDVEMNGNKMNGDKMNGDEKMDDESEDELDVYMRRLNQHHSINN